MVAHPSHLLRDYTALMNWLATALVTILQHSAASAEARRCVIGARAPTQLCEAQVSLVVQIQS